MVKKRTSTGHYFEDYDGPTEAQWKFLVGHLQTPNLTADVCLKTVFEYMRIAVKHESTWKTRMMREDYFPVARLYYCGFLLIHPHFEIPKFWQMGMHILHMLSTLNYRPAILTLYRYFEQIARHRDPKSETYRYIQGKYQELVNKSDANACTWKAVEVWNAEHPLEALMYLNKAMEGYKRNRGMYKVEPLVDDALKANGEKVPFWVKTLTFFSDIKETILGLVIRKETTDYALRRREMIERLLPLDKKAVREPLWTWEGVYRTRKGMALSLIGHTVNAVEELRIAADELDQEEGHYALATILQFEAEQIDDYIQTGETHPIELLTCAFPDLYDGTESMEVLAEIMRVLNEEAELRFKRAAQGGDVRAAQKLAGLCETRKEDPGLSKREKETYELAAKEWAKIGGTTEE